MATLQQQGVPWNSRLQGPSRFRNQPTPQARTHHVRTSTRTPSGWQTTSTTYQIPTSGGPSRAWNTSARDLNPVNMADKSTGSVGALEGEFLICIGLLTLIMFANSTSSFGERIMSFMKRGSLTCAMFFILALVSTIGPNANKVAKVFGGLLIVVILLTSPIFQTNAEGQETGVLPDIDALIKNDWVGTPESENDTAASADAGTSAGTTGAVQDAVNNSLSTLGDSAVSASEAWLFHLSGPAASDVNNAVDSILKKLHL